ncbi:MAG: S4 domain-containing protein [Acholeplasma sp.]|nr:S4 domain-containing protein [Acholeplasma sp.]
MRLDLFLKTSRLIKRRKLANDAASKERVLINDKLSKPAAKIKIDDIITLNLGLKQIVVKVTSLTPKKDELMYQLISETYLNTND